MKASRLPVDILEVAEWSSYQIQDTDVARYGNLQWDLAKWAVATMGSFRWACSRGVAWWSWCSVLGSTDTVLSRSHSLTTLCSSAFLSRVALISIPSAGGKQLVHCESPVSRRLGAVMKPCSRSTPAGGAEQAAGGPVYNPTCCVGPHGPEQSSRETTPARRLPRIGG